jgi:glycosyltransferase involved in cell wall biosynthesis
MCPNYLLSMKILMFGWEFPPHISGGLGTACRGLTKGLSELPGIELTFVVPRRWGDEDLCNIRLIGANQIPIRRRYVKKEVLNKEFEFIPVKSEIIPYQTPGEFWKMKSGRYSKTSRFIEVNGDGKIEFTGLYGPSLYQEIRNYAIVAERISAEVSFDIIHAHDWLAYPAGIAVKKITGKPLVIHVHATEFDRSGEEINPQVYAIEREGMEMADKIITVSNLTQRTVIEKYGIDPRKIITVYNAVESFSEADKIRIKNGINDKIVTFIGRITRQKGPEYFVEAASLVLKKMDKVRFVMAGSGDLKNAMVQQVARLGIADRFHFTGFLMGNEVTRMLMISDAFVMPSVSEPFGIVPLEAMQLSVPVIISRQSGVSEIIKNVLKIDFWDTFAMADAIHGLLTYPVLPRFLVENGNAEAGNLSWKNVATEVVGVYQQALNIHIF